jgi:beta-galactosidase
VFANPVRQADGQWLVPVEVTLNSCAPGATPVAVEITLFDPAGKPVAQASVPVSVNPFEDGVAKISLRVESPQLWSVDAPALYEVRTVVKQNGRPGDAVTTRCGFRTIRFDADKGFFLNDRPLKLQGVCNHQDHAGVGVAVPDSLWDFRLRKLKEMGVNACRCSHNPPAKEFLDTCDRLGLLVMDENRNFNSTPEYQRQLEWMVRRDRNHPSVILWSVFNEEPMQGSSQGYEMVRRMSAAVKRLDTTRPVTAAMNGGQFAPVSVAQAVDVVGFNYSVPGYDRFHQMNPKLPMTSSEDTSAFMTRGEYVTDPKRKVIDSYDDQHAPWGWTHRGAWKDIATRPFIAGGFVWTGFDYRGEPTPHSWPSVSSFFGCMDLCGFPKAAFYMHQALWVQDQPVLQLIPHWNWAGQEGKPIKVMAVANCESVELTLNGRSLGDKPVDKYEFVSWEVPYAPGKLEAVGKINGREVSRCIVETTGPAVALELVPDRVVLAGDGWDAEPVTVRAVDAQGRIVPTADSSVEFEVAGPGAIIGLGNGDPNCHEQEKGNRHSIFNGLGQVILQTQSGGAGQLTLRAKSAGLKMAETTIVVNPVAPRSAVAVVHPPMILQNWRMSPITATAPDPNQQIADNDMNSWSPVEAGRLQTFSGGNFAVYRIRFEPNAGVQAKGGRLVIKSLTGKAEVWLDGKQLGRKNNFNAEPLTLLIPAGEGNRTLSILIEAPAGKPAGFGKLVTVENN